MRALPLDIGIIHFVGIGGIGMSGIAEILHNLGYKVQGSDQAENANVRRLAGLGVSTMVGHRPENLGDASVAIESSATALSLTGASSTSTTLTDETLFGQTITTTGNSNLAMVVFEKALDTINANRATIGAKLNRLEAVVRNLENVRENVSAARSRIQDADFAEETARMTKAQILQQAGTAMVAQANQSPQSVLALLQV